MRLIALGPIASAWGGLLIVTAFLVSRQQGQVPLVERVPAGWGTRSIVFGIAGILCVLLVIALVAPPNTWDGMTYHMSRVVHWEQNGSVAPYATSNGRQVHLGPGAEYLILNLQILSGGDRFANGVQWFALLGSIVGVSLIARGLGAGRDGQLFAAALCGALPMAVLQATSTQNDLALTFWLVCVVAVGLEFRRADAPRPILIASLGLSAGLAMLTKATAYVILPPMALFLLIATPLSARQRAVTVASALLLALLINAGFFARNAAASGSVLGPGREDVEGVMHQYKNEAIGVRATLSNVLRNGALELVLPLRWWNDRVDEAVRTLHVLIGMMPSDPRTTLSNQRFHLTIRHDHEDQAPAPILALLILVASIMFIVRREPERRLPLAYLACVGLAFFLFCAALKWQPWHARLHLPMLVLACAAVGLAIERYAPRAAQAPLVLLVMLAALPNVFKNPSRPVWGADNIFTLPREPQYFANRPEFFLPYRAAVARLAALPCHRVGLIISYDGWEYPLWALLKRAAPDAQIEHVGVRNYTGKYADPSFDPCVILRIGKDGRPTLEPPAPLVVSPRPEAPPGSG
jgi:hypothetical protein